MSLRIKISKRVNKCKSLPPKDEKKKKKKKEMRGLLLPGVKTNTTYWSSMPLYVRINR